MDSRVFTWMVNLYITFNCHLIPRPVFLSVSTKKVNFMSFLCLYFTLMRKSLTVFLSTIIKFRNDSWKNKSLVDQILVLVAVARNTKQVLVFFLKILATFHFSALLSHNWQQCQKWFWKGFYPLGNVLAILHFGCL